MKKMKKAKIVTKITAEHYSYLERELNMQLERSKLTLAEVKEAYATSGLRMKRMRWDLLRAAKLSEWVRDNIYTYANDTHIDRALRKITNTD